MDNGIYRGASQDPALSYAGALPEPHGLHCSNYASLRSDTALLMHADLQADHVTLVLGNALKPYPLISAFRG